MRDFVAARPHWGALATFYCVYVVAGGMSQGFAIIPGISITFWPPAGLMLATLAMNRKATWPWWLLAGCVAELTCDLFWFRNAMPLAFAYFFANAMEAITGAWLLQRFAPKPFSLNTLRDVARFIALAVLAAPVMGATIIAGIDAIIGKHAFTTAWPLVWLGDASGLLVSAPLTVVAIRVWRARARLSLPRLGEALGVGAVMVALTALSFIGLVPTIYLALPALLWIAARFQLPGATVGLSVLALTLTALTASQTGSPSGVPSEVGPRIVTLQAFLGLSAVCALVVAAISAEGQRAREMLEMANDTLERQVIERTAKLSASETWLARLLDQSPAGILHLDAAGQVVLVNARLRQMLGFDDEEILSMRWEDMIHPDCLEQIRDSVRALVEGGADCAVDHRYRREDGSELHATSNIAALRDRTGRCEGMLIVVLDLTERLENEARLRESEGRLSFSLRAASAGAWEWNILTGKVKWSHENYALHDLDPRQDGPRYEDWLARIHPEDVDRTNAISREILSGDSSEYRAEYRVIRRDGSVRWLSGLGALERNAQGKPIRLSGINLDVTERKTIEAELSANERRHAFLLKLSDSVRRLEDPSSVALQATRLLGEEIPVARTDFYEDNSEGYAILASYAQDGAPSIGEFPYALIALDAWNALCRGEDPLAVQSVDGFHGPQEAERLKSLDIGAYLNVPIVKNGRIVAGIAAYAPRAREWSVHDIGLARDAAERVWPAVKRARAETALRESESRFRLLFESIDEGFCVAEIRFDRPDGRIDYRVTEANPAFFEKTGFPNKILGAWLREAAPGLEEHWYEIYGGVARTGEAVRFEQESEMLGRWFDVYAMRVGGAHENRVAILFDDISERKRHEAQTHLLMREVNHRSMNMLAVIQAIAKQTVRTQPEEFFDVFSERVQAMATNQSLLVKSEWKAISLEDLARSQLSHFADALDRRITLEGAPVMISPSASQTLGMAVHELATNAAKYGALSSTSGCVHVRWGVGANAAGQSRFAMSWVESGGPVVAPQSRRGFGTIVIEDMVKASLGGEATIDFAPSGFSWRIDCPAERVVGDRRRITAPPILMEAPIAKASTPRPRVLVVEDETLIALDIASCLAEAGWDVVGPAATVREALEMVMQVGCDAAVVDTNLGEETAEPIVRQLYERGAPFVVVSGYTREQQPAIMRAAPLVAKPLDMTQLIAAVKACLG
jgi:PAS domain S-box-containing protein